MGLPSAKDIVAKIKTGDRVALGRAITWAESRLPAHQQLSLEILDRCFRENKPTLRLGITGVPGVGKSTFIDQLGKYLTGQGKKVAVLAIDPSSQQSKGSILGDKTRMEQLGNDPHAFIRPSPARNSLGGVERATRKSIILCEAAGYDVVLIETVGVGQSETEVSDMVDFFLLLMLPGAGDELQGIKRGIVELADGLFVNKSDLNPKESKRTEADYKAALHLMPPRENGESPFILAGSSQQNENIGLCWDKIIQYTEQLRANGRFTRRRKEQYAHWMMSSLRSDLFDHFYSNPDVKASLEHWKEKIDEQEVTPFRASENLLKLLISKAIS